VASLSFVLRTDRFNLTAEGGAVRSDTQRRARNVRDRARELARERSEESSGALPASIRYVTVEGLGEGTVVAQVGSDLRHARWVEDGTGIYGPRGRPIKPVRAKFLVFESRRFGRKIIASSVRGQPGKHYLRDALAAARE
jgi:hypothetical protein